MTSSALNSLGYVLFLLGSFLLRSAAVPGCIIEPDENGLVTINSANNNDSRVHAGSFHGCKDDIKKVVIDDSIIGIDPYAFWDCRNMKSVTMNNISFIGEAAFIGCVGLETVNFGDSPLTVIEPRAFAYNEHVTELQLPKRLKRIAYGAFTDWSNITALNIPDSVEEIAFDALSYCNNVKTLKLPNNDRLIIGKDAFEDLGSDVQEKQPLNFNSAYLNISDSAFGGSKIFSKVFVDAQKFSIGTNIFRTETLTSSDIFYSSRLINFHRATDGGDTTVLLREEMNLKALAPFAPYNYRCLDGYGHTLYEDKDDYFYCLSCKSGSEGSILTINSTTGRQVCSPCKIGTYSVGEKITQCTLCPSGKVANNTGSTSCTDCEIGKFSFTGSGTCSGCPPGRRCNSKGLAFKDAEDCAAGTYNKKEGRTVCDPCPAGTYQGDKGQAFCTDCVSGKYNSINGSTTSEDCLECPIGTFSPGGGASMCSPCIGNTYTASIGLSMCESCGKQYVANDAKTGCIDAGVLAGSIYQSIFDNGMALIGTFLITSSFILVAGVVTYYRESSPTKLANYTRLEAIYNSFLAGFGFGSTIFLIMSISQVNPGLGTAMILFRLLHFVAGAVLLVVIFAPASFVRERVDPRVNGASLIRDYLDADAMQSHIYIIEMVSFVAMLDVTMFQFMPWKKSRFFVLSEGYPSLGVMKFCLCFKLVELLAIFVCELSLLGMMPKEIKQKRQAVALIGMSVAFMGLFILTFGVYAYRSRDALQIYFKDKWRISFQPSPSSTTLSGGEIELGEKETVQEGDIVINHMHPFKEPIRHGGGGGRDDKERVINQQSQQLQELDQQIQELCLEVSVLEAESHGSGDTGGSGG